ncbi:MAG: FkbM family methyltransferase [Gammaproteobacteria bacterium]
MNLDVVRASGQHTLRTHLMRVLRDYKIDSVIDVGASEGGFGLALRRIGFAGEIYSFEPVQGAYEKLYSLATKDPRWTSFNMGLGAVTATATINVSRFSQLSSFLHANRYGLDNWENMEVERRQEVEMHTLDECFQQGMLPRGSRYLLKMDTQGFDLEVFKGAVSVQSEICSILSELSLIPLYHGMPHYLESLAVYEQAGFLVSGFFPITRNSTLALNEVDCFMVNARRDRVT